MCLLCLLCCRLCPGRCVFKPELLGGQEVTCLCETPLETNGEEPGSWVVYYADGVLLSFFELLVIDSKTETIGNLFSDSTVLLVTRLVCREIRLL